MAQPALSDISRRSRRLSLTPARRLAIIVAIGLSAFLGVTIWRMQSLDGLPDVGDPFDVAEARRPVVIPDADNAFVAYEAADQKLRNLPSPANGRPDLLYEAVWVREDKPVSWASAHPGVRRYVEAKRAALEIWREGSECRDAVYHQPSQLGPDTSLFLISEVMHFAAMAAMEVSRLEDAGARDQAWDWYRAMLRSSRLIVRHGMLGDRTFGAMIHALAARCILRWAADPRAEAGLLRRALRETLAADALTPPVSEAVKLDYLYWLKCFDSPQNYERMMGSFGGRTVPLLGGRRHGLLDRVAPMPVRLHAQRLRLHSSNELERSRRAFRLLFANWLAQVDRPPSRRAPLALPTSYWIYADDPSAPPAARAVRPEFLAETLERLQIGILSSGHRGPAKPPPWESQGELGRERRRRSVLIVRLAAEIYRREHGAAPAAAGALLGSILKELPEGIAANDPIPAGLE
jgi:hypothetical protein